MKKYFAISDVHSFYEDMIDGLRGKGFDENNEEHFVIICGDAFDRGEASLAMFTWMKKMITNNRLIYVRGNHEDLMFDLANELIRGKTISSHHVSNGTVQTVADLTCYSKYDILYKFANQKTVETKIKELLEFIEAHAIDYFILDKTVFVHGWVPTTTDEQGYMTVPKNWRNGGWSGARWENGMEMFHFGLVPEDMHTIVCGHWHASFGWHTYEHKCSEWDEDAIFDPYIKTIDSKTIVALDGCTAYTRQVNCVVFDEKGNMIN